MLNRSLYCQRYIGDEADVDGEWVAVDYETSLSKIFDVLGEM